MDSLSGDARLSIFSSGVKQTMNRQLQVRPDKPKLFYTSIKFSEAGALSRLISAAVVDSEFRSLLLSSPQTAMTMGYNNEYFCLAEKEIEALISIQADSLSDFAAQLDRRLFNGT